MTESSIDTLFLDIGGVLLTNGWDRQARQRAAETYGLDYAEMDHRHHLTFDTYEEGKLSLDDYLTRVVFYEERSFSRDEFKAFMYEQSRPHQDMLDLVRGLKQQYGLRVVAVSNEGRELNLHRIQAFALSSLFDAFISSSFVHFRKPDLDIYQLALDVSQSAAEQVLYIDDRAMFVQVARTLGIRGIHHTSYRTTCEELAGYGLTVR